MNDDRLRRILHVAEEPLPPSPEFATTLLGQLRGELGLDGVETSPVGRDRAFGTTGRRRRPGPGRLLLVAALLGLVAIGALAAAGAFRRPPPVIPPLADVPFHRVDLAGSLEMPGPGPDGEPEQAWQAELGPTSFAPILAGGKVIVASSGGRVSAIDARTGAEAWHVDVDAPSGEFVGAAAAADRMVFIADPATLYALDLDSGAERWRSAAPNTGARPKVAGGIVYTTTTAGAAGFDTATGAEVWSWTGPGGGATQIGPIADGVAYIGAADGRLHAISIADGTERWSVQTISRTVGSAELAADTVFVATAQGVSADPVGELYAIERDSGRIRWRFRGPSGLQLNAGPVRDGILYVSSEGDGTFALRDDGTAATQVWHVDAPQSYFPLSAAGETLYEQRYDGSIGAYSIADGTLLWETPARGANGGGSPVVSGGMVFAVDQRHGPVAFADRNLISRLAIPSAAPRATTTPVPSSSTAGPALFSVARTHAWETTGLVNPLGMAPGPDGLLYVLDTTPKVSVIDPADGHVVRAWGRQGAGPGEFDLRRLDDNPGFGDIAVAPDGRVYVADGTNRRVQIFRPDGSFVSAFGIAGDAEDQFAQIAKIAIAPDGSVYTQDVKDASISKFTPDGTFVWRGPEPGSDPDIRFPAVFPVVRSDGVVVTTAERSGRIVLLDPVDGHIRETIPVPEIGGDGFGILELDPADNMYVQVYAPSPDFPVAEAILVFDPTGAFLGGMYRTPGSEPAQEGRTITYGDWYFPTPIFMPDGRAFTFSEAGLTELKVTLP